MSCVVRATVLVFGALLVAVPACTPGASGGDGDEGGQSGGGSGGSAGGGGGAGKGGSGGSAGTAGGGSGGSAGRGGAGGSLPPASPWGLDARPENTTCVAPAPPTGKAGDPFPQTLKATGCVDRNDATKAVAGAIPYTVRSPLWSDAADKQRYMALPANGKIAIGDDGHWTLPIGSVLVKFFAFDGKPFETRLLVRHASGDWAGYTYKWRADGSDADLYQAPGSPEQLAASGHLWYFPTSEQCLGCHTKAVGRTIGPETAQLNGDFVYPSTGKRANQIATLQHIGLFERDPGDPAKLPALPSPSDDGAAAVEQRARAYLHANCAHCHRPGGLDDQAPQNQVSLDLRFTTPLAMTRTCDVSPEKNNYGDATAKLIKPGDTDGSILSVRLQTSSAARMPAIGSLDIDIAGAGLVDEWIRSLKSCP